MFWSLYKYSGDTHHGNLLKTVVTARAAILFRGPARETANCVSFEN